MKTTWRGEKGYTLAEILVVAVIFLIVLGLTTTSFNRIVSLSGQTIRSEETDIEGVIGLEVLRSDLELAGFGLPWSFENPGAMIYSEARQNQLLDGYPGTDPWLYNDAPRNSPRAIVVGNRKGYNGSDYLVLKGSALGSSKVSRQWTYMTYTSTGAILKTQSGENALVPSDKDSDKETVTVIALNNAVREGVPIRELVMNSSGYYFPFTGAVKTDGTHPYRPKLAHETYVVYGITAQSGIKAPFNRADYYLFRPDDISRRCAAKTGVLYKAILNQSPPSRSKRDNGAGFSTFPLLECVADFQVLYGFLQDTSLQGFAAANEADLHLDDFNHDDGTQATARDLRDKVTEMRVYILAHEGTRDRAYVFPNPTVKLGRYGGEFDLRQIPDYEHYRWKVYTIVVHPKNLR